MIMTGDSTARKLNHRIRQNKASFDARPMRISVIIPVLNEEKTIAETLAALLALAPHEVIVVDGGSVDRTREMCARAGVTVLCAARGRARQMNRGAQEATGEV